MGQKKHIIWDEQPLGEMSDSALAKRLGVAQASVRYQRMKRGIERVAASEEFGGFSDRVPTFDDYERLRDYEGRP